jgi:hypothetical protein
MPTSHRILKRASASRPSGEWNKDDFDVLAGGAVVGRIGDVDAMHLTVRQSAVHCYLRTKGSFMGKLWERTVVLPVPAPAMIRSGPALAFHEPESLRGRITKVTKNECAPTGPGTITSNSLRQRILPSETAQTVSLEMATRAIAVPLHSRL